MAHAARPIKGSPERSMLVVVAQVDARSRSSWLTGMLSNNESMFGGTDVLHELKTDEECQALMLQVHTIHRTQHLGRYVISLATHAAVADADLVHHRQAVGVHEGVLKRAHLARTRDLHGGGAEDDARAEGEGEGEVEW